MAALSTASNSLKWVSLVVLIAQTTALVLTLRYSRTQKTEGSKYLSSTAIVTSEVVKFITCIVMLLYNNSEFLTVLSEFHRKSVGDEQIYLHPGFLFFTLLF